MKCPCCNSKEVVTYTYEWDDVPFSYYCRDCKWRIRVRRDQPNEAEKTK
jgi:hypothetical protein